MKPHGVDVQISMLITSAIMFWLGKFALGIYSANTGWQPQSWWSENLWGIVPAAPFFAVFLMAASLGGALLRSVPDGSFPLGIHRSR